MPGPGFVNPLEFPTANGAILESNKAPEDVFAAPLAPPILDPLGSGSKRAFFLAEAPVPDGPADCSSS